MEQIVTRMRRYASEIFDTDNILYSLHLDDKLVHKKPGMEYRRDVYLIFKELVNNVHKHASAKNVTIDIKTLGNELYIIVEDDGVGFITERAVNRNGLKNISARVAKWKGIKKLSSTPGKGTSIEIRLPLES
jgi:signal transduction histidine kinase